MNSPKPLIDPLRISTSDAAHLLSRVSGRTIAESVIHADVASGAPANADGTLNLVHYGAWLIRQLADGESSHGD